ncbi:MAG: NYN domain-containing protein [Chloroflexi bacterium]|nr:NYN domain-containing protein [Chloroflexota bacterium]
MAVVNVAVLIDYENVGLDSIQYLLDQISDVGRITIKRAYADWSTQRNKRDQLLELGIEAIHHFRSTKSGKNSSDIRLVIDAIDLRHTSDVDTFVVVSSDSDFVPLVMYLRAAGKSVMAAGRRDTTAPTLVKSVDRYIYLDDAKPAQPVTARRSPRSRPADPPSPIARAAEASVVSRAVEASVDESGQVVGSKLYQTILRIDPSFNFKALGFRTFRQFLQDSNEVRVTQPPDASDVVVQLEHGQAPSPSEPAPAPSPQAPTPRRRAPARSVRAPAPIEQPSTPITGAPATSDNGTSSIDAPQPAGILTLDHERQIDAAWDKRGGPRISSQAAAADTVKVFGVSSLKETGFATLEKLLQASRLLQARWRRDGNAVHRR